MINFEEYLYERVKPIIENWNDPGIYAISFYVYSNGAFTYQHYNNISEFAISYNTEEDNKKFANPYASENEVRWNYAFWRQNTTHIIDPNEEGNEGIRMLFQWYSENGIENIGFNSDESQYDENYQYIGKGPGGYYELLTAVSNVARKLQLDEFIREKFGAIPIIIHGLEYNHLVYSATENANPNGEAADFLKALETCFGI